MSGQSTPLETMIDDVLMSSVMGNSHRLSLDLSMFEDISRVFGKCSIDLVEDYTGDRDFSPLHEVLLGIDCSRGTLEDYLSSFSQVALPREIIDAVDSCGRTPLAWAVEYGWPEAVSTLLRYGADPLQQRRSLQGNSPLLHLAIAGPASQESNERLLEVIRLLLRAGADFNAVDHEGWTPLHVAASWNLYPVIAQLAHWANGKLDWDARTNNGETALDLSVNGGGDEDVIRILQARSLTSQTELENHMGSSSDENAPSGNETHTIVILDGSIEPSQEFYDAQESM
jgi:ankyrin repeat protein